MTVEATSKPCSPWMLSVRRTGDVPNRVEGRRRERASAISASSCDHSASLNTAPTKNSQRWVNAIARVCWRGECGRQMGGGAAGEAPEGSGGEAPEGGGGKPRAGGVTGAFRRRALMDRFSSQMAARAASLEPASPLERELGKGEGVVRG